MTAKVAKAHAFKLITDSAALQKESLAIVKAQGKFDDRIQSYLLSEIDHISKHSNTTRLNDFLNAMKGKGGRVNAMLTWLVAFGPLDLADEGQKPLKLNKNKQIDIAKAKDTHWTSLKPEPALRPFDLNVELAKIVNKAVDLSTNRRENVNDEIPDTTIQKLLELAAQLGLKIDTPEVKAVAANDGGAQAKEAA